MQPRPIRFPRRLTRTLLWASTAVASACAPGVEPLTVPIDAPGSLVFVTLPAGGTPRVQALELPDPAPGFLGVPVPPAGATVYALRYGCPLSVLGLHAGPQVVVGESGGRSLPKSPRRALSATWQDGESALEWKSLDGLPDALAMVRIAGDEQTPCVHFDIHLVDVVANDGPSVFLPLGGEDLLLATASGRFFRISGEAVMPLPDLPATLPHAAGFRDAHGDIWLRGADGRVARGDLERGFTVLPSRASATDNGIWLTGPSTPSAPDELFAVTQDGAFEWYDGVAWRSLDPGTGARDIADGGGVAWVGPGEALAIGPRERVALRAKNGVVAEEDVQPPQSIPMLTGVATIPGFGVVVGADRGFLYVQDGTGWHGLPNSPLHRQVLAIAPLDHGLAFGGEKGVVAQYHPDFGFCPTVDTTNGSRIRWMIVEDDRIAVALPQDGGTSIVFLVRSGPRPPACDGP